jgi:hypothetical protein
MGLSVIRFIFNLTEGTTMLEVHYENLKHFDAEANRFVTADGLELIDKHEAEERKQADTLGWLMMTVGVHQITEKTISEIIFRVKFLDFCWGKSYFVSNPTDTDLRQLFKNHIGLKIAITNRGIQKECTRHKFMIRHLSTIVERIEKQIKQ